MADLARVTQVGVELLTQSTTTTRVSQVGVELITYAPAPVRVSQLIVEILIQSGVVALPAVCPTTADDPADGPACTAPVLGAGS